MRVPAGVFLQGVSHGMITACGTGQIAGLTVVSALTLGCTPSMRFCCMCSFRTTLCLQFPAETIAYGALYMAHRLNLQAGAQ